MSAFLIYIIKSTVYLGLFFAFYMLAVRNTTFFRFNRWMLLGGTVVCLLLPFFTITVEEVQGIRYPMQALDGILASRPQPLPLPAGGNTPVIPVTDSAEVSTSLSWIPGTLMTVYLLGAFVTLALTVRSFLQMWRLIQAFPKRWEDGVWLIIVPVKVSSFSWGRYIVLNEEDACLYPSVKVHERAHIRHHHSRDMIFFTLINVLHWFNPLVWLARTELQQLHEYEADEEVIHQGIDATQYQLLLVRKAVGSRLYSMANGFNRTKLKKRITMMLQEKTNGRERLKWLAAIPVVMGAMCLFAQPEVEETMEAALPSSMEKAATGNRLEDLRMYFRQKVTENDDYTNHSNGRALDKMLFGFYVNKKGRVLLEGETKSLSIADVRTATANYLRSSRKKCRKQLGKDVIIGFNVHYDAGVPEDSLVQCLTLLRQAFEEVQKDYHSSEELYKICPTYVHVSEPRLFGANRRIRQIEPTGNKQYSGIELTFNGDPSLLANPTTDELKAKVKKHLTASSGPYARIKFKARKDLHMGEVNEVRRLLRDLYHPQEIVFRQSILND